MDTKIRSLYTLSTRDPLKTRDTYRLRGKGWKKIFYINGDQKKAGIATFTSDKIDFKIKAVKRDKEGHYTMIKGSVQEEGISSLQSLSRVRLFATP